MILPVMKRVNVLRHDLSFRLLHWLIFAEGVVLTLSGLQLGGIFGLVIFPSNNLSYHEMVGLAFVGTALLYVYYLAVTGDYKWALPTRIPYANRFIFAETKAWFGRGPKPENPIIYDTKKKRYVEKIIPSAIAFVWTAVILAIILSLTGLALAFPVQFSFVYLIADPIGRALTGVSGPSFLLALHRLTTLLLVAVVAMHTYATFVFGLVRSIVFGRRDEIVMG